MSTKFKLEFVALTLFASDYQHVVPFTRDYELIRTSLAKVEPYGKTNIETALDGVRELVQEEWGTSTPCQILLITDGRIGTSVDMTHLTRIQPFRHREYSSAQGLHVPFQFPAKLNILCLENSNEPRLSVSTTYYQRLIEFNNAEGSVWLPEGNLSQKSVGQMVIKLCDSSFVPFHGELSCGNLSSRIQLYPPPERYHKVKDFDIIDCAVSNTISICGFLEMNDVSSPAAYSRHLVLPLPASKGDNDAGIKMDIDIQEEESSYGDDSKTPSFCVLLHGSLKVEGMVALCEVGPDWYGILYSWADSKKKSNLMLTLFEPGLNSVPWLGQLNMFVISEAKSTKKEEASACFPVKPAEKRSYTANSVVWIRPSGLQADIQKLLRHARKLPDKTQNFYKELNRIKRATVSFGFYGLLESLATILERECTLLPGTAHPDAALQLTHAANSIRSQQPKDFLMSIMPLRTKFSSEDV
ncbi:hypothetical protein CHUAL_010814 [Chamberlinius hualienensis]